ncbi:MAG: hypothetical protein AAB958_02460, partial [Patescibacteria group bacterium]
EFLGNGCDIDNIGDFETRDVPNPQNSSNFPEPRTSPTIPQNFQINYNASTTEIKFSWQESQDYSNSTSTLIYKIIDLISATSTYRVGAVNSFSTSTLQVASTTLNIFIDEVGRDYNFSIQAFDGEGLSSEVATSTIFVPSFLSNLYFYADPRASSTAYLIETFYGQYPFVPDVYQNGNNISWKAMIFYLNSEAEKRILSRPGFFAMVSVAIRNH